MEASVGIIGLGNMGGGIVSAFLEKGGSIFLWDIEATAGEKFADRAGATWLPPAEMAAEADVILFAVPSSRQIEQVFFEGDEVLGAATPGTILVDLTTSDPGYTKDLASRAAAAGLFYLDAGMSGGAQGAAEGRLTLMIGGDAEIFAKAKPVLEHFAKGLFHMGPSGAGHTAKLLQNMVTHTIFLATCEAGRLGERAGIDLSKLIDLFNVSNARSFISERRFPDHIVSEKWDGKSRVFNLHKDLGLAVEMAEGLGLTSAFGRTTLAALQKAVDMGMEESDFTHLYSAYEDLR